MRKLQINRIYRHFKGDYYLVVGTCFDSEENEEYVLYRSLYGNGKLWARKKDNFLGEVNHQKYPNVKQKYSFQLMNIESVNK